MFFSNDNIRINTNITYSIEAFARTAVSGLLLDPETPLSALFTTWTSSENSTSASTNLSRQPSLTARTAPFSLTRSLATLRNRLLSPFTLHHARSPDQDRGGIRRVPSHTRLATGSLSKTPMLEKLEHAHAHLRHPAHPSYAAEFLKSDGTGLLELPFKLSVERGQATTKKNMPYLRHSWNRLDFFAVVGFWVSFVLATVGQEHALGHHIGLFRALSVLRAARLLAITSGTTAIMRSLKTALPLLANVAYFVVFAIGMFS
jgi:voltage-dependent calcium channel